MCRGDEVGAGLLGRGNILGCDLAGTKHIHTGAVAEVGEGV